MRVLLISVGTRGDAEPFLSIAEILKVRGHSVACAFPEQFRNLADETGVRFISLGTGFTELVESDDGKLAMGGRGNFFNRLGAYVRLYAKSGKVNKELVERQCEIVSDEKPDCIVYNGKAVYPTLWGIQNPNRSILVSPVPCLIHPVKNHPNVGFKGNYGAFLNRLTYSLANAGFVRNISGTTKELRKQLNISTAQIKKALLTETMIYTVSPTLFPRPDYWPSNVHVLGFYERNKAVAWHASHELEAFLARHEKIVLISFGSIADPEAEKTTAFFLDVLQRHQIPAIMSTGAGGLIEPQTYDSNLIHFVKQAPHDWLMPRIYAVIHHGGSGTTHMALKYGCPSMIIPHLTDQYLWNDLVSGLGAGPKGIAAGKLTEQKLEPRILDLFRNPTYKSAALRISEAMKKEDFTEQLCRTIAG